VSVDETPSTQRNVRTARKLNRKRATELAARGLTAAEIAEAQGVHRSTVWRFLQSTAPERQALVEFKKKRGDVFARIQGKSLDLQERILESIDDRVLSTTTLSQKSGLLHVLNAQAGTLYDKERLETGKSTSNVSLIGRMMGEAVRTAYQDTPASRDESEADLSGE
jgi:transcriptional regulator with XRE-family HTH domain